MIPTLWTGSPTDPFLNRQNCLALDTLYTQQPLTAFRGVMVNYLQSSDSLTFLSLDNNIPPTILVESGLDLFGFFAGTSGSIHVPNLIAGWENPYDGPYSERGLSGAFGKAVATYISRLPSGFFASFERAFLIGHSFGGAVAQALAVVMRGQIQPETRVWSYGSPRPGRVAMQTWLSGVTNTRFYGSDDPVRYIPPHSTENPALAYLTSTNLVQGMDVQVQPPTGWEINELGEIRRYEGNPNVLTAVGLNVASWILDEYGLRSEYHSLAKYRDRFNIAYVNSTPPKPPVSPNPVEAPEVLTVRERLQNDVVGEQMLIRDATDPAGATAAVEIPTAPMGSPARYKRKKMGRIWVVQYDGETVAVGPGKRRAGQLARKWNKVLRAEQFIMSALS